MDWLFLATGQEDWQNLLKKRIRLLPEKPTDFSFKTGGGEVGRLLSFLPILVTKFKFNNFEMILEETAVKTLNISVIEKDVGPRWQNRPNTASLPH